MRQAIDNFIHRLHTATQSEQGVTISLREESIKLVQIYNDGRYSLDELTAILEDDVTILLREYRNESESYERDKNNDYWKSVHESKIILISGVLMHLIDRAASVRVFLSDDYLRNYEDDKFLNTTFAGYVRNEYKAPEPQQEAPEAQQQPSEIAGGQLADNGNVTPPDEAPDDAAGNDDEPQYIELPDVLKISDKAQPVFTKAVTKGWMEVNSDGTAEWIGVTQPNEFGEVKAKWRQLAYMCGETYGFKYDLVNNQYGNQGETVPWTDLQNYFGISGVVNLAHEYAGAMEARNRPPAWRKIIDKMISSISI